MADEQTCELGATQAPPKWNMCSVCSAILMGEKQHGGHAKNVFGFQFYCDNLWISGVRRVKYCMKIDHKRTYNLRQVVSN